MLPRGAEADDEPEPVLTLYRDTNGWCPFCERVWLGLREKGIPFNEVLIDLYDKPQWYKDMVPTSLVPAVKFAGSGEVVWESDRILRHLDDAFPDSARLFAEPARVEEAAALTGRVMNASMGIAYRVGNLTEEEVDAKRRSLEAAVDELDARLARGGPFLLGEQLTAADCMAVPMLERYGVQMPFTAAGLQLRDAGRWPGLARWYEAMEKRPSYAERVQGDAYSWTAVTPVMMRLFGGQNGTLQGAAAARADAAESAARALLDGEGAAGAEEEAIGALAEFGSPHAAAVAKLLANHEAVVADAVNTEPRSQKELARLDPEKAPAVDAALRATALSLLSGQPPLLPPSPIDAADVAAACRYVAARVCVPRDLGAPAGAALRRALLRLAGAAAAPAASPAAAAVE